MQKLETNPQEFSFHEWELNPWYELCQKEEYEETNQHIALKPLHEILIATVCKRHLFLLLMNY